MRLEEAKRIAELVTGLDLGRGAVCLNVGSSTKHFREVAQPHIRSHLLEPLEDGGIKVVHCDIKPDVGVDLVGDVLDVEFQNKMESTRPDLLLCCNILEHLKDPQAFAAACMNLVRPGGYMVVSVPMSYPYHPDPMDSMLRVTPEQLSQMFPCCHVVAGEVVKSDTFLAETLKKPGGRVILFKYALKAIAPFYRPRQWWPKARRLSWLFRPYKSSVVLMQKPSDDRANK